MESLMYDNNWFNINDHKWLIIDNHISNITYVFNDYIENKNTFPSILYFPYFDVSTSTNGCSPWSRFFNN